MTTAGPNVDKQPLSPAWCSRTVILGENQLKMVETANISQHNEPIHPLECPSVRESDNFGLVYICKSHSMSRAKNSSKLLLIFVRWPPCCLQILNCYFSVF